MQELLLFGQIVQPHHTQVLHILAGLCAMQPQPLNERHIIYKPSRVPSSQQQRQQPVQTPRQMPSLPVGDLFYLQGVVDETLPAPEYRIEDEIQDKKKAKGKAVSEKNPWTLQFRDFPEPPGRRPVMSRLMYDIPMSRSSRAGKRNSTNTGDGEIHGADGQETFMAAMDYFPIARYTLKGQRFTYGEWVNVRVYRTYLPSAERISSSSGQAEGIQDQQGHEQQSQRNGESGNVESLLDSSGAYILEASVKVSDGQDLKCMGKGTEELVWLRDVLKGCVDLEVGERGGLDTRVR